MSLKKTIPAEIPFVIRKSRIQGKGAYATRRIKKGERIIEYVGERISWAESDRRYDDTKVKRHHTFLFAVNKKIVIDAAVDGNEARFINHSCDPNCEAVGVGLRIFIESIRPIEKGEELVYDYSYAREKGATEEDEKLYVCHCGSPKCRGTILEAPKKRKRRKKPAAKKPANGVLVRSKSGVRRKSRVDASSKSGVRRKVRVDASSESGVRRKVRVDDRSVRSNGARKVSDRVNGRARA